MVKTGCIVFSSSTHSLSPISVIALAGGYKLNFFVELPLEMYMSPDLQLIKASAVASQGLPKIIGCPPRLLLGVKIIKSTGYSQESKETEISSNTPSGLIIDRSASCSKVGVKRRLGSFSCSIVCLLIMLIAAPKSINVFGISIPFICVLTIGLPGSTYFCMVIFPIIMSAIFPTRWILLVSFSFLPGLLKLNSFMVFARIGISRMACSKGILIQTFFNSSRKS